MGNTSAAGQPLSDKEVQKLLPLICDATASQAQRRPAFERLRQHFAPALSGPAFAEELRRVFALRFERWPAPGQDLWEESRAAVLADHIRGCLYGAALGDASGLATEFLSRKTVLEHYGNDFDFKPGCEVFADIHRIDFPSGDWSDDTDQLLLILQTLLESGGKADVLVFGQKLNSWRAQGFPGLGDKSAAGLGQHTKAVLQHKDFSTSPADAARAVWEKGGRKSAANGAVMRTAVTGIPFFWDMMVVTENTQAFCSATHADPRCMASCLAVAHCVSHLLSSVASGTVPKVEDSIAAGLVQAEKVFTSGAEEERDDVAKETWLELERHANAATLEDLTLDDPRGLGYTFKCLGSALWAARACPSLGFEETLRQVILQGGDADTNGCVAGALAGCLLGYKQLPERWIKGMPYAPWFEAWVQKLLFMMHLPVVVPDTD